MRGRWCRPGQKNQRGCPCPYPCRSACPQVSGLPCCPANAPTGWQRSQVKHAGLVHLRIKNGLHAGICGVHAPADKMVHRGLGTVGIIDFRVRPFLLPRPPPCTGLWPLARSKWPAGPHSRRYACPRNCAVENHHQVTFTFTSFTCKALVPEHERRRLGTSLKPGCFRQQSNCARHTCKATPLCCTHRTETNTVAFIASLCLVSQPFDSSAAKQASSGCDAYTNRLHGPAAESYGKTRWQFRAISWLRTGTALAWCHLMP